MQGVVFVSSLVLCGLSICWLILPLFVLLMVADVYVAQRVLDWFIAAYLSLPACLLELFGVRVRCFGQQLSSEQRGEFAVLLSNHPTTADWLFLWCWLYRNGDLSQLKIVLKSGLRAAPIIGWALQLACHLFLARDWSTDQRHVQRVVQHYRTAMQPAASPLSSLLAPVLGRRSLQLLVFPEGTNMRPAAKQKSDAYAAKLGQPAYNYVLHPHTTGFSYIINALTSQATTPRAASTAASPASSSASALRAVYDLTVAFPGTRIGNLEEMFVGYFPSHISFLLKRHPIAQLPDPSNAEQTSRWLVERYSEKERELAAFYARGTGDWVGQPESAPLGMVGKAAQMAVVGLWWLFGLLMLRLFIVSSAWRMFALLCSLAFGVLSWMGGGDALVLWTDERRRKGRGGSGGRAGSSSRGAG